MSTSKEHSWAKMSRAVTVCAGSLYKRIHFHCPACLLQSKYNATAKRVQCQARPQRANARLLWRALHLRARSSPCCESRCPQSWSSQAASHSPARLDSQLGERLSLLCLPSQSCSHAGSSQLSPLQGPWEQHCHVRDLFLLSDTSVHMGTHGPEGP